MNNEPEIIDRYKFCANLCLARRFVKAYCPHTFQLFLTHFNSFYHAEIFNASLWNTAILNYNRYNQQSFIKFLANIFMEQKHIPFCVSNKNSLVKKLLSLDNHQPNNDIHVKAYEATVFNHIPCIPIDNRLIFLLKLPTAFWSRKHELTWDDIAKLNNISTDEAHRLFFTSRDTLIRNSMNLTHNNQQFNNAPTSTDPLALCVFLLKTQIPELNYILYFNDAKLTNLLNISVSSLQARFHFTLEDLDNAKLKQNSSSVHM